MTTEIAHFVHDQRYVHDNFSDNLRPLIRRKGFLSRRRTLHVSELLSMAEEEGWKVRETTKVVGIQVTVLERNRP